MDQHSPEEDYETASQEAEDYVEPDAPKRDYLPADYHKHKRNWRKPFLYMGVLVVLAGIGGGIYQFVLKPKPAVPAQTAQTAQSNAKSQIDATTKHYDSPNFYLGINYPADWTLTDNGGGKMTIISPSIKLKNAGGQSVDGEIVVNFSQKGQNLTAFDAGNAIAVMDSEKIAYSKPTASQRANTYLSFLQYAKTTASGALDAIYITGDNGYQKGQAIPKVDIAGVDPQVSVIFQECADTSCSGTPKVLSLASSAWSDTSFAGPIKKMLASLSIN